MNEGKILDIVSILSVENVFYSPREEREKANVSHKRFASVFDLFECLPCVSVDMHLEL